MSAKPSIDLLTENCENPDGWFKKYELFIELFGIAGLNIKSPGTVSPVDDEESARGSEGLPRPVDIRAKLLPFYLGGRVFVTYDQFSAVEKCDYGTAKKLILLSYGLSGPKAYSTFTGLTYKGGSIDMFVAELRRVLDLVPGMRALAHPDKDGLILEQLLRGLPQTLASQLRLVCADPLTGSVSLTTVLAKLRVLPGHDLTPPPSVVTGSGSGQAIVAAVRGKGKRCFRCGAEGHLRPECTFATDVCFECKKPGHAAKECPARAPNGKGSVAHAPAPLPQPIRFPASKSQ